MFTQGKAGPSDGPGGVRFARCQAGTKLWQKENEKRAGEKPTRKKHQPGGRPKADQFTRSKAAIVLAVNADGNAGGKSGFVVTPRYGQRRPRAIVFEAEMSNPYYWAEIEYQGAAAAAAQPAAVGPARNTEKLGLIIPIGSRSSILGGPGELNFE